MGEANARVVCKLGVVLRVDSLATDAPQKELKLFVPKTLRRRREPRSIQEIQVQARLINKQSEQLILSGAHIPEVEHPEVSKDDLKKLSFVLFDFPTNRWSNADMVAIYKTLRTYETIQHYSTSHKSIWPYTEENVERRYNAMVVVVRKLAEEYERVPRATLRIKGPPSSSNGMRTIRPSSPGVDGWKFMPANSSMMDLSNGNNSHDERQKHTGATLVAPLAKRLRQGPEADRSLSLLSSPSAFSIPHPAASGKSSLAHLLTTDSTSGSAGPSAFASPPFFAPPFANGDTRRPFLPYPATAQTPSNTGTFSLPSIDALMAGTPPFMYHSMPMSLRPITPPHPHQLALPTPFPPSNTARPPASETDALGAFLFFASSVNTSPSSSSSEAPSAKLSISAVLDNTPTPPSSNGSTSSSNEGAYQPLTPPLAAPPAINPVPDISIATRS